MFALASLDLREREAFLLAAVRWRVRSQLYLFREPGGDKIVLRCHV